MLDERKGCKNFVCTLKNPRTKEVEYINPNNLMVNGEKLTVLFKNSTEIMTKLNEKLQNTNKDLDKAIDTINVLIEARQKDKAAYEIQIKNLELAIKNLGGKL